ncbi:MAG: hypothetical protein NC926_01280 [Candidatus Omnitrophica bacterium]|nr:hypothetical protein [Candidatus Omnitrophota bacterium]
MERISRKLVERIKKLKFFILFFLIKNLCFSQEINIFEEIEAKSLKEIKTKIFDIFPSYFEKLILPELPEIKFEEPIIEKKEERVEIEKKQPAKEEKKKNVYLTIKTGSFSTKKMDLDLIEKFVNFTLSFFHTENYRKNSEILNYELKGFFEKENKILNIDLQFGEMSLPGPEINPLSLKRDFLSVNWLYSHKLENFYLNFSHNYYSIEEKLTNFLNLNIEKNLDYIKVLLNFEGQISKNSNSIFGFSPSLIFSRDNFLCKFSLKLYNDYGIKFLPEFFYNVNNNFSIFLESNYGNPDLWKDLITDNWKTIKEEKFSPEIKYKGGLKFNFQNLFLEVSHSYNNIYLWEYDDLSFLYIPEKTQFQKTSFILNSNFPISENLSFVFNLEKNIFYREIMYLPTEKFLLGFDCKYKDFSFKFYNTFTGKRRFNVKETNEFNLLNLEIAYKKNIEFGLGIYNVLNKNYEIAPYYPGEKRKFLFWIKF